MVIEVDKKPSTAQQHNTGDLKKHSIVGNREISPPHRTERTIAGSPETSLGYEERLEKLASLEVKPAGRYSTEEYGLFWSQAHTKDAEALMTDMKKVLKAKLDPKEYQALETGLTQKSNMGEKLEELTNKVQEELSTDYRLNQDGQVGPKTAQALKAELKKLTNSPEQPHNDKQENTQEPNQKQPPQETEAKRSLLASERTFKRVKDQLIEGMEGAGTDEQAVYKALRSIPEGMGDAFEAYWDKEMKGKGTLQEWLKGDFSGGELEHARALLDSRRAYTPAEKLHRTFEDISTALVKGMSGVWNPTDEYAVYGALERIPDGKLNEFKEHWNTKMKSEGREGSLEEWIAGDFSGEELVHVMSILERKGRR